MRGRMAKKAHPGRCPEQELIALRTLVTNQAREVFCDGSLPATLINLRAAVPSTFMLLPSRSTSAGPLVVLDTALLPCSKQDQPRQTFFLDRPRPAIHVRIQIRAPCWRSKRIHASRLDQFSKGLAGLRISVMQQIAAASQVSQSE